jgi:hypothetical protein
MRWNLMLGTMMVVGALSATQVRAQESAADDAQPKAESTESKQTDATPYGAYVEGPATVDANGVPVAKPNPMSRFQKRSRAIDNLPMETPLVDQTNGSASGQQAK